VPFLHGKHLELWLRGSDLGNWPDCEFRIVSYYFDLVLEMRKKNLTLLVYMRHAKTHTNTFRKHSAAGVTMVAICKILTQYAGQSRKYGNKVQSPRRIWYTSINQELPYLPSLLRTWRQRNRTTP
jgi:hypothetical protein